MSETTNIIPPVPMPPEPESKPKRPRWLVPLIAAVVAVVLVVAGVVGWNVYQGRVLAEAKSSCARAADTLRGAANEYNALLNGDAADMMAVTTTQVKDAKTLKTLAKAAGAEAPEYAGCVADDAKGLDEAAATLDSQAGWYARQEKSLKTAVEAVASSKLDRTVDDANNLLKSSEGRVADNRTREALSKAVKDRDEAAIGSAVKAVNDSVAAKSKADAEAKAAAEAQAAADAQAQADAAAAAQAQQSVVPNYGGWSGGSATPNYGGGATGGSGGSTGGSGGITGSFGWNNGTPGGAGSPGGICPESVCGI
jgi:hypothetical protein